MLVHLHNLNKSINVHMNANTNTQVHANTCVQDPERSKDPVEFVQGLLDMRDKYETIVMQSFHEDKLFRNALNQVRGWADCVVHFLCLV